MTVDTPTSRTIADPATWAFARARSRDPRGDVVHFLLALAMVGLIGFGTAPPAVLSAIVALYAVLRAWATIDTYGTLIMRPVFLVLVASLVWHAVSLMWSIDPAQGADELRIFRLQIPVLLLLWPIIDRWRWLIWAFAAGAAVIGVTQILHRFGVGVIEALAWPRATPDRYPGFLHPMNTSVLHAVAIALLCGPLLAGRGTRSRFAAAALLLVCGIGLLLAGSRNLWLAALIGSAVTTVFAVGWSLRRDTRRMRGAWLVLTVIGLVTVGIAAPIAGPLVAGRIGDAVSDVERAIEDGEYRSHGGARLRQWTWSWQLLLDRPLSGVGIGAYRVEAHRRAETATRQRLGLIPGDTAASSGVDLPAASGNANATEQSEGDTTSNDQVESAQPLVGPIPRELRDPVLPHPHSALAYAACTLGVPGLGLYAAFWALLAAAALRQVGSMSAIADAGGGAGVGTGIDVGTGGGEASSTRNPDPSLLIALPGAVAALFVAFALDCHNLSAQGTFTLSMITAIALRPRSLGEASTPWWSWSRSTQPRPRSAGVESPADSAARSEAPRSPEEGAR